MRRPAPSCLVVERSMPNVRPLVEKLRSYGCSVTVAHTVMAARAFMMRADFFHVVILNISVMNTEELLGAIQKTLLRPFLAVYRDSSTASTLMHVMKKRAVFRRADECLNHLLSCPFEDDEVFAMIRKYHDGQDPEVAPLGRLGRQDNINTRRPANEIQTSRCKRRLASPPSLKMRRGRPISPRAVPTRHETFVGHASHTSVTLWGGSADATSVGTRPFRMTRPSVRQNSAGLLPTSPVTGSPRVQAATLRLSTVTPSSAIGTNTTGTIDALTPPHVDRIDVLVIDADKEAQKQVRSLLSTAGRIKLATASGGSAAFAMIRARDVGVVVAEAKVLYTVAMLTSSLGVPLIILTDSDDRGVMTRCKQANVAALFAKPLQSADASRFTTTVRKLLRHSCRGNTRR